MIPAQRWYTPAARPFSGTFASAAEGFRDLLEDAVRLRLRADVPVGTCLSGGLDSSSIAMLMARQLRIAGGGLQHSFTAASRAASLDERPYAELVAEAAGVVGDYVYPEADELLAELSDLVWVRMNPSARPALCPASRLRRGTGGRRQGNARRAGRRRAPQWLSQQFRAALAGLLRRGRWPTMLAEMSALRRHHGYRPRRRQRYCCRCCCRNRCACSAVA